MPESNNPNPLGPESFEGINFGTRECLACHEEIDAQNFGGHVFSHDPILLKLTWPGGIPGVLDSLTESLQTSFEAAEGHPEVQTWLRLSLDGIDELRRRM